MAWNKPSTENQQQKTPNVKAPSAKRGIIAVAAVVVALGALSLWMFSGNDGEDAASTKKDRGLIKEVTPSVMPKAEAKPAAPELSPRERQLKEILDRYGDNIPDNLKATVEYLKHPPVQSFHPMRTKADIFKCRSDRQIAAMLMITPGDWMLRKPTYDEMFDSDFEASLNEKIEFEDSDTDEQRELKEAVIATREDLAKKLKFGIKPSDIMNSEADSLYQLGNYRRDLQNEITKISSDENVSDEDVRDLVSAANQMLKSKGLAGFQMPNMAFRQVSLKLAAEQRKRKAAQQIQTKGEK